MGRFLSLGVQGSTLAFRRPECAVQRRRGKAGKRKEPVGEVQAGTHRAVSNVFLRQATAQGTEGMRGDGADLLAQGAARELLSRERE